jgi:imidazole glycerol-phosphate synthase subunit HisH
MIVVIDYGMGNIGSILNMLKKVGAKAIASSDIATIGQADKLILPGVGSFDHGRRQLNDLGLVDLLNYKVLEDKVPILGLCLGMQLFTRSSEEGQLRGLGWFDAETVRFRFDPSDSDLKILHMGWDTVNPKRPTIMWDDMYSDARFYFAHSYHVVCHNQEDVTTTTHYGYEFASAITRGNIVGMQFHPEKSHKFGMKLFKNFSERC